MSSDSFTSRRELTVGPRSFEYFALSALDHFDIARLPYALKILLENLLRHEDGESVTAADIEALATWDPSAAPTREIAFSPARILLQDFTGVPAVVDMAAMRDGIEALGGDPARVEPHVPAELVIDHSVIVDRFGTADAFAFNAEREFDRNRERYQFLRWGQQAFDGLRVVPPETGICHQVNLEYLARVVFDAEDGTVYPDTLVGTDSHTPMVNGLGVVGWGVGGIEAEAAMLGQPVTMLVPRVVGFKLHGELVEGVTATDLVLTIAEQLRGHGVVGKFVEFYGPGVGAVPLGEPRHDREHVTRVRVDDHDLPDRRRNACGTCASPDAVRSASRWSRHTPRLKASGTTRTPSRRTPNTSSSTSTRSSPASRDRRGRTIGSPYATRAGRTGRRCRRSSPTPPGSSAAPKFTGFIDRASADSFPASDPPELDPGTRFVMPVPAADPNHDGTRISNPSR